jgi:hypothetical protein
MLRNYLKFVIRRKMKSYKSKSYSLGGYFTVEAALVMPIVIACVLLIIYMWFFQYDRCLLEMDTYAAVLRSVHTDAENNEERLLIMKKYVNEIYRNKYAAWELSAQKTRIEKGKAYVEQSGSLKFPFKALFFWNIEDTWNAAAEGQADILNPAFVVRRVRQIMGGK